MEACQWFQHSESRGRAGWLARLASLSSGFHWELLFQWIRWGVIRQEPQCHSQAPIYTHTHANCIYAYACYTQRHTRKETCKWSKQVCLLKCFIEGLLLSQGLWQGKLQCIIEKMLISFHSWGDETVKYHNNPESTTPAEFSPMAVNNSYTQH